MTKAHTAHVNELTQSSLSEVFAVATGVAVALLAVMVALTYLELTVGMLLGAVAVALGNHGRVHLHKALSRGARTDVTVQTDTRNVSYDAD